MNSLVWGLCKTRFKLDTHKLKLIPFSANLYTTFYLNLFRGFGDLTRRLTDRYNLRNTCSYLVQKTCYKRFVAAVVTLGFSFLEIMLSCFLLLVRGRADMLCRWRWDAQTYVRLIMKALINHAWHIWGKKMRNEICSAFHFPNKTDKTPCIHSPLLQHAMLPLRLPSIVTNAQL
jgi:hypothetical protein